jgi:hypothetical protein
MIFRKWFEPRFFSKADLDQAADGFGAAGRVLLLRGPGVYRGHEFIRQTHCAHRVFTGRRATRAGPFAAYSLGYCIFHKEVLPYSGLKNKRPETRFRVRVTPEWKEHVPDLAAEMLKHGMLFDVIDWSGDRQFCTVLPSYGRRCPPVHAIGLFCNSAICLSGWMMNLSYFLPGLLTGRGNVITGRVGLVRFPQASLGPHLQNI